MTKKEFVRKYSNAPVVASDCAQITWDMLEKIEETLEDGGTDVIGSCRYDIETLLEVMDTKLPDYQLLSVMYNDLNKIL